MRKLSSLGLAVIIVCILLMLFTLIFRTLILIPQITLLLLLVIFSTCMFTDVDIKVSRHIEPSIIFPGDAVNVSIRVKNMGDSDIDIMSITDYVDSKLRENYRVSISIKSGEEKVLTYSFNVSKRGRYRVGPIRIRIYDKLLFSYYEWQIKPIDIIVLPKYESAGWTEARTVVSGAWPGSFLSRRRGESTEFRGVREYVPGDVFRRINWRVTAKYDKFMINEFESENITELLLILDVTGLTEEDSKLLDDMVDLTASLAYTLIRLGNRVGIINHGGERRWIAPGYGKIHLIKILESLSVSSIKYELPLTTIVEHLPRLIIRPGSFIIIVSSLISSDTIQALSVLRSEGYRLAVICPVIDERKRRDIRQRIRCLEQLNNLLWASRYGKVSVYIKGTPIKLVLEEILR